MKNDWTSSGAVRHYITGRSEAGSRGLWVTPHTFRACERVPKWGGVAGRPKSQPRSALMSPPPSPQGLPAPAPSTWAPQAHSSIRRPAGWLSHCIQALLSSHLAGRSRLECHRPPTPRSLRLDGQARAPGPQHQGQHLVSEAAGPGGPPGEAALGPEG